MLGVECAGKIVSLGEGVEQFHIGDEVVAIAPYSFGSFVTTAAAYTVAKPAPLSFEQAAAIPIAFVTASYALHHLARLNAGERVLIHTASGGVGLAAIQLTQRAGAEVFATAGSPEKREFLRSLGIQHVMDSRSLSFVDRVREATNGQGVDVVLNSLAGEAISAGLSILKPYGRFLEIGKRDIFQNSQLGLQPFQKNLSFFAIDLDRLIRDRPTLVGSILSEVVQNFKDGMLQPLRLQVSSLSDSVAAFRTMSQAKHIGKIVMTLPPLKNQRVTVVADSNAAGLFRTYGTYLITGGLGNLGLAVAEWMVQNGAQHIVLLGRHEASSAAQTAVEDMQQTGAQVLSVKADIAEEGQVARVLAELAESMPPLRGIIHAAGLLDDGILLQLDHQRFASVLAPKMQGAWNLHTLTRKAPLDFFVLFSSAASLFGSPGQGNYVAANAFLDALAHYRRGMGLTAVSINWGPWAEIGLAARPDRAGRLAGRGVTSLTQEQGIEALERVLRETPVQVGVVPISWSEWGQSVPGAKDFPLFRHFVREQAVGEGMPKGNLTRAALVAAAPGDRQDLLEAYVSKHITKVLGLLASDLDADQPLDTLGIDSLMALELTNRVETDLGLSISIVDLFQGAGLRQLVTHLLEQLPDPSFERAMDEGALEEVAHLLEKVEQLSEQEAQTMLQEHELSERDDSVESL